MSSERLSRHNTTNRLHHSYQNQATTISHDHHRSHISVRHIASINVTATVTGKQMTVSRSQLWCRCLWMRSTTSHQREAGLGSAREG